MAPPKVESSFVDGRALWRRGQALGNSDGDGLMRPIPRVFDGAVELLVLIYSAGGPIRNRTIRPPRRALRFRPDGTVFDDRPILPNEVGIDDVGAVVPGFVSVRGRYPIEAHDRLLEISPAVWRAWVDDDDSAATEELAAEYWAMHCEFTSPTVAPWYEQAAPDFFDWVRRRARVAGS